MTVCDTAIRQDSEGRYCLNGLHKAAGGRGGDRPSMWMHSEAWLAEKRRIAEEANRKRAEATKAQHEVSRPWAGEEKPEVVVQQSVGSPSDKPNHTPPATTAKAKASKTNAGAVQRGDLLVKQRPDLPSLRFAIPAATIALWLSVR